MLREKCYAYFIDFKFAPATKQSRNAQKPTLTLKTGTTIGKAKKVRGLGKDLHGIQFV